MTWKLARVKGSGIDERWTILHSHNKYQFLWNTSSCPLCKELVPDYILFQWKLLDTNGWWCNIPHLVLNNYIIGYFSKKHHFFIYHSQNKEIISKEEIEKLENFLKDNYPNTYFMPNDY